MAPTSQKLSLQENLVLVYKLLSVAFIAISAASRAFIRYRSLAPPFAVSVYTPITKYLRDGFTRRELVAIGMPQNSNDGLTAYCQKHRLEHSVDKLANNAAIHWVGPRSSTPGSKLLLYIHGGGYITPIAQPQISLPLSLAPHIPCTTSSPTTTAFLAFSLAPESHFPTPLHQLIAALSHILTLYPPSSIILGGESSGGHLILALLSYLSHPNPSINSPALTLPAGESLGGVFLMSPLVNRSTEADSYSRNADKDFTDVERLEAARGMWAPRPDLDGNSEELPIAYLDPLLAGQGWWENIPVKRILITTGMWEVMADDCVAFGKRLQKEWKGHGGDVTLVECPFEVHASAIVEETFGIKGSERGSKRVTEIWLGGGVE